MITKGFEVVCTLLDTLVGGHQLPRALARGSSFQLDRALAQDFGFINIGLKPEFDGIPLTPG